MGNICRKHNLFIMLLPKNRKNEFKGLTGKTIERPMNDSEAYVHRKHK